MLVYMNSARGLGKKRILDNHIIMVLPEFRSRSIMLDSSETLLDEIPDDTLIGCVVGKITEEMNDYILQILSLCFQMTSDLGKKFTLSLPEMEEACYFPYDLLDLEALQKMKKLGGISIEYNARIL